jgi:hypothetical protein
MRLVGLRFLIGTIFIFMLYLAWVSLSLIFFFVLLALILSCRSSVVSKRLKLRFSVRHEKVKLMHNFDGNPALRRFCQETSRNKSPAWSGESTEGLASPSDSHMTANIISCEDLYRKPIMPASFEYGLWSQVYHQSRLSSSNSMLITSCTHQLGVES